MSAKRPIAVAVLALSLSFATHAFAQRRTPPAPVISGAWTFQTAPYDGDRDGRSCTMKGSMVIVQGRTPNELTCTFTATETCPFGEWVAEQTCTAKRTGDKLDITSTVRRVTPNTVSYAPDNWQLTIRTSDLMVGELRSADIANVQFRRGPSYTS
jgi:hypothetical protein